MLKLDKKKCQTRVFSHGTGYMISHQCTRKVTVEIDGRKYCSIHNAEYIKTKEKKYWEKIDKKEKFEREMEIANAIRLLNSLGFKIIYPKEWPSS